MPLTVEATYQIGDLVFGGSTMYQIQSIEVTGYTTNVGDLPLPRSDELRFRKDYIQPGTILFTLGIVDNYNLDGTEGAHVPGDVLLENLMKEWRADDVRKIWGYTKPLTYRRVGTNRRVYGRPRDIAATPRRMRPGWYDVTLSYQRADSLVYDDAVSETEVVAPGGTAIIDRTGQGGGAPTWMTITVVGPINDPVITIGSQVISIDHNLAAGKVIQVNSFPWERRAIDSDGNNLSPKLIAASPYLDELILQPNADITVGLAGSATSGATGMVVSWREAYHAF